MNRRELIGAAGLVALSIPASRLAAQEPGVRAFPDGFLWGASTSGHQVEGNDTASDTWFLANIRPTAFAEPAGDAANSFALWETDLDLCVAMGLNAYRFSVEWSRIEPEQGLVSQAALDHYARIVEGCHARGLAPIVTFNHFTSPRWFAAAGGWLNPEAGHWFAEQCRRVMRAMGDGIHQAITFNEPNLPKLLGSLDLPPALKQAQRANLDRAGELTDSAKFVSANVTRPEDVEPLEIAMEAGHALARDAIKAERSELPVGLSIAIFDDQAGPGGEGKLEEMRNHLYRRWLDVAKADDFLGVQNYERAIWGPDGRLPAPEDVGHENGGTDVYAPSLAGAVRYAHAETGKPILVTEHGINDATDLVRQRFIPDALGHLHSAIADGVPVTGYCHWSLLDNFEWIFGYGPRFGLVSVDRTSFRRMPKLSSVVYERIARANAL